ncbi:GNAT family N-acetyltransferase [Isoptericola variabilis]|uniref:GCN5-related N-acetyltransferase n=1 Tax=Isoptericola variabilis (strain 225) TaxID=743718 RepID=F6FQ96_ISOV2|nr:GNAT family N-acetyltransferase [Isoptericola variabilis]AEG42849.1 GCN5-related N-acetyltransferase [Isoptericola variabilis 225]TWH30989.1 putative acetyltransferase [Isoptericola variabilis J7]
MTRADATTPGYEVRRVRADEWRQARDLRLEALADPAAPIAFLESLEAARAHPDGFWRTRTRNAARGDDVVQVVAVEPAGGRWVGTLTALLEQPGADDVAGDVVARRQVMLVAVYVSPGHRGRGLLGRLVDEALSWARGRGAEEARLFAHTDNARARAAYERLGFTGTGRSFASDAGQELEMVRGL